MNVIAAKLLPFLVITATILPASSTVDMNTLVGKKAEWDIYFNLDNNVDVRISMDNIVKITDPMNASIENLACTITIESFTNDTKLTINDNDLTWHGIDFFKDYIPMDQDYEYCVAIGVVRECIKETVSIDGVNYTAEYDRKSGLLLNIYIDHKPVSEILEYYLRLRSSSLFVDVEDLRPVLITGGVLIGCIAIVFTIYAVVVDRRKRSTRACFDAKCWV